MPPAAITIGPMRYPALDSEILSLGPLALRWYSLAYIAAFAVAWWLGNREARRLGGWTRDEVSDLIFIGALGVILGGRLGYVFFYGFERFLDDPLWALRLWQGGMSFHGGLLGVIAAMWLFARRTGRGLIAVADFTAPLVPIGLGFGRLANFVNTELPGRVTDSPFGMHYPCWAVEPLGGICGTDGFEIVARHPSPLYQAFLEGVLLGSVLWLFSRRPRPPGSLCGLFLVGYGALRLTAELFRQPDAQLGFLALGLTMGQWLSVPMLLGGAALIAWGALRGAPPAAGGSVTGTTSAAGAAAVARDRPGDGR